MKRARDALDDDDIPREGGHARARGKAARPVGLGRSTVVGKAILRLPNGHAAPETLSPNAVVLLNAIANLGVAACDPWAKYPPVLGVDHVAEILGTSSAAVSEAARVGTLPMVKVQGKWRIDQVEFRRFCGYRDSVPVERTS